MRMELDEKEMEAALCEWASKCKVGDLSVRFNAVTFYKLDRGYSAMLEWVEPTEQGR